MPNNPQKSLPTQRRNELLNAIDSVVDKDNTDNKEGLRELLRTTAWMENTLGHNPNAYGRTYTNGPMSLDDIAYKDLFSPIKDKNGVSTGRFSEYQRKILDKLKEFGYSDLETFTKSLKSDDPLASVLAARFYYGLNPAPIPEAKDRQSMFNYYKDNYNKGGMAKYQDDETALNRFNSYYDSELNQPSVSLINTEEHPDLRQIDNAAPAVSTHVDMGQVRDIDFSTQEGSVRDISQGNKIDISDSVDPQTLEAQPIKMAAGGSAGGMMSIVNQMNFDQIGEQAISSQASGTSKMGVDPYSMGANILSTGIDAFAKPKGDYGGANDTAKYDGARQAIGQGLTMVNPIVGAAYQVGTSIGGAFRSGNEDKTGNQVAADLFNPSEGIFRAIEEKDASYAIPIYGAVKAAKDAQEELKKREAIESAANFTANQESQATVLGRSNQRQSNAATPKRFMANGGPTDPPKNQNTYADSLSLYNEGETKYDNLINLLNENNLDTENLGIYPALDTDKISPTYKIKLKAQGVSNKGNYYTKKDGSDLFVDKNSDLYNTLNTPINSYKKPKKPGDMLEVNAKKENFQASNDSMALYNNAITMGKDFANSLALENNRNTLEYLKDDYDEVTKTWKSKPYQTEKYYGITEEEYLKSTPAELVKLSIKQDRKKYEKDFLTPIFTGKNPEYGEIAEFNNGEKFEDIANSYIEFYKKQIENSKNGVVAIGGASTTVKDVENNISNLKNIVQQINKTGIQPVKYLLNLELPPMPIFKKPVGESKVPTKINSKKGEIPTNKLNKALLENIGQIHKGRSSTTIFQSDPTTETGQYAIGENVWNEKTKSWKRREWDKDSQNASKKLVTKNIKSKMQFANGGILDGFSQTKSIKGRSHAQGGIPMGKDIEVEGGEVRHKNFIFTNRF